MPLPVRIILHEIQWSAKQFFPPYFLNHSSDARVPEDPPSPARDRQAAFAGSDAPSAPERPAGLGALFS